MKKIGEINLSSKVIVSDPCYDLGTWCSGTIDNLKPGKYNCYIIQRDTDWGKRVCELIVIHQDVILDSSDISVIENFEVGVDSATAGIFDYDYYAKFHTSSARDVHDEWWQKVVMEGFFGTKENLNNDFVISDGLGVMTTSGYGDGGYDCFTHSNSLGQKDAIKIVFITEEEEEEEDYGE